MILNGEIRAVVLDVEGTTTSISFVFDVLFPYAKEHLGDFVKNFHDREDVQNDLGLLASEYQNDAAIGIWSGNPVDVDGANFYLQWLIDQDRKSPALKSLQGKVWQKGYQDGTLKGHVYDDVPPFFQRLKEAGVSINIYSSGSVLAQKLLFSSTKFGDLTREIDHHFDTSVGGKREAESYRKIASEMNLSPGLILFVSDVPEELNAAHDAGFQVLHSQREGVAATDQFESVRSFNELSLVE